MKGTLLALSNRPNRNWHALTAVDLWQRAFRFKETPAARAGTKRRIARERKARGKSFFGVKGIKW